MKFVSKIQNFLDKFVPILIFCSAADDPPGEICEMSHKKWLRQHLYRLNENGLMISTT